MKDILGLILVRIINNISDEGDIKDIKGLIIYEVRFRYILVLLILAIVICLFILFMKKKSKIADEEMQVLPPDVIALDRLEKLKGSKLIEQKRHKEYYTILSDIIREYLEGKYNISAMDQTTYELVCEIKNRNIFGGKVATIQEFLTNCDMVKFAKHIPLEEDSYEMLNEAVEIINIAKNELAENKSEIEINV